MSSICVTSQIPPGRQAKTAPQHIKCILLKSTAHLVSGASRNNNRPPRTSQGLPAPKIRAIHPTFVVERGSCPRVSVVSMVLGHFLYFCPRLAVAILYAKGPCRTKCCVNRNQRKPEKKLLQVRSSTTHTPREPEQSAENRIFEPPPGLANALMDGGTSPPLEIPWNSPTSMA